MRLRKQPLSFLLSSTILLSLFVTLGIASGSLTASPRLPNVTSEMERPEFWIKQIANPTKLLLTPEKIRQMNEENLGRQDLYLCRIKDLKEDWKREEILSLLKEDWEKFGKSGEGRYGKGGIPLEGSFWSKLKTKLNQESIGERGQMLYALIIKRTDIRVFPTEELLMNTPHHDASDRFQQSSLSPGSPIGIYHFSKDREWAYVQTRFIRGWVRTHDLAIAKEKKEVVEYEETKDRLVVTGNSMNVFDDPSLRQPVFLVQMGDSFPLLSIPGRTKEPSTGYVIHIPFREDNGRLTFRKAYIPVAEDLHQGFLPYTQERMARQAFKMLHHPYGWGDRLGGRDCSRFILDLFRTFGILMPRNSMEQGNVGIDLGGVEGTSEKEKRTVLDQAIPLATTLRLPGHIMLYLGKDNGRYYVIHSIWGIQRCEAAGTVSEKIGKVVVSDLNLGGSCSNGSLFSRLTGVRFIGERK